VLSELVLVPIVIVRSSFNRLQMGRLILFVRAVSAHNKILVCFVGYTRVV